MIDLTRFSAKDDIRDYLNSPYQEGGHAFATNGVIAVMLLGGAQDGMKAVDEKMAGRVQALIAGTDKFDHELTVTMPADTAKTCPICDGTGFTITTDCDDCDGAGEFEHGRHTYMCKECEGEGVDLQPAKAGASGARECESCGGFGTESRFLSFDGPGGPYKFQEKYLRLALSLPGCRILVGGDNQAAARLEFDGGTGLLMPIRF